jgi:hypothetical protein
LGVRTGWNAAAACHQAGLAGTFGAMENSPALVTGAGKGIGQEIAASFLPPASAFIRRGAEF